jgi:hypothetical protein
MDDPLAGTYFATNAGGSWSSARLTKTIGAASLTLDPATGDAIALVIGGPMSAYRLTGGAWSREDISDGDVWSGVLRADPSTGSLFLAYIADPGSNGQPSVRVRLKS